MFTVGCIISGLSILTMTYAIGWDKGFTDKQKLDFDLNKMWLAAEKGPDYFSKYSMSDLSNENTNGKGRGRKEKSLFVIDGKGK